MIADVEIAAANSVLMSTGERRVEGYTVELFYP